jgi:hypothetical protein
MLRSTTATNAVQAAASEGVMSKATWSGASHRQPVAPGKVRSGLFRKTVVKSAMPSLI